MKSGGDLNDALQPAALVAMRSQPDFFPGFVGFEEPACVEVSRAAREFFREAFLRKYLRSRAPMAFAT